MKIKLTDGQVEIFEESINKSPVLVNLIEITKETDKNKPINIPLDSFTFKTLMTKGALKKMPLGNLRKLLRGADYLEMEPVYREIIEEITERFITDTQTIGYFIKNDLTYYDWSIIMENLSKKDVSVVSKICGMDYFSEICDKTVTTIFKKKLVNQNKDLDLDIVKNFTIKDLIISVLILDFIENLTKQKLLFYLRPVVFYLVAIPENARNLILNILLQPRHLGLLDLFSKYSMHINGYNSEKLSILETIVNKIEDRPGRMSTNLEYIKFTMEEKTFIEKIKKMKMYSKTNKTMTPLEFVTNVDNLNPDPKFYIKHFYQVLNNIVPVTVTNYNYDNSLIKLIDPKSDLYKLLTKEPKPSISFF